jgi:hypothetical protein
MATRAESEILIPRHKTQEVFEQVLYTLPANPNRISLTLSALGLDLPEDRESDDEYYKDGRNKGIVPGSLVKLRYSPTQGLFTNRNLGYEVNLGQTAPSRARSLGAAEALLGGGKPHQVDVQVGELEYQPEEYAGFVNTYLPLFDASGYCIRSGAVWLSGRKALEYGGVDRQMGDGIRLGYQMRAGTVTGRVALVTGNGLSADQDVRIQDWFAKLKATHSSP